jgi:signal transduction histidine kinase
VSRRSHINRRIFIGVLGVIALFAIAIAVWAVFFNRQPILPGADKSISLYEIPAEMVSLEEEARQIREEMSILPELKDTLQNDQYGYHGGYLPALEELPEEPRWTVDVIYGKGARMRQLIIVPAMDRRFDRSDSYGFPLRFRVSKLFSDGQTELIREWMNEDCPNPGRIPLILDVEPSWPNGFRIEVFRGAVEGERELLALDEVYGITVNNEIIVSRNVEVSSSFESLPYWHQEYLIDHKTSLGLPLGGAADDTNVATDLFLEFDSDDASGVTVEFDLGENLRLSGLLLYPASNRTGNWIPGFGFPGRIEISVLAELPNGRRSTPKNVAQREGGNGALNPGYNVLRLPLYNSYGRWVRVKFCDFPSASGKCYFSMGEVMFLTRFQPCSVISTRQFRGYDIPEVVIGRLSDGRADGLVVMRYLEWIRKVQARNILSLNLDELEEELQLLRERLHRFYWRLGVVLIAVVLIFAIGLSLYLALSRRESSRQLREQITLDLHDDMGSSLSAISLGLRRLRRYSSNIEMHSNCDKLDSIIQRVQASFQDVLWFTNSDTDTLSQLIAKLVQTAELRVPKDKLFIDLPGPSKDMDRKLKLMFKRDLLFVFSEAVNNAVKHSNATEIYIGFHWEKPRFTMTVYDNGEGFDLVAVQERGGCSHLGLQSLQRRAKRLGGNYDLQSQPGQGTCMSISLKL